MHFGKGVSNLIRKTQKRNFRSARLHRRAEYHKNSAFRGLEHAEETERETLLITTSTRESHKEKREKQREIPTRGEKQDRGLTLHMKLSVSVSVQTPYKLGSAMLKTPQGAGQRAQG